MRIENHEKPESPEELQRKSKELAEWIARKPEWVNDLEAKAERDKQDENRIDKIVLQISIIVNTACVLANIILTLKNLHLL